MVPVVDNWFLDHPILSTVYLEQNIGIGLNLQ